MDDNIINLTSRITNLYNKYKSNDLLINKLIHMIDNTEKTLDNLNLQIEEKNAKTEELTKDETDIIQKMINDDTQYFYLQNKNIYFLYYKNQFEIIDYNDLIIKIYNYVNLSNNKDLIKSKYKIQKKIIKEIKSKSIFNTIPNSTTIQNTLKLFYPSIFKSKEISKYFLTIIGDCILKKNNNLQFYVNENSKQLINNIQNNIYVNFGIEVLNNIKYKMINKEDLQNYRRFIPILNNNFVFNIENMINIFVISCHYSVRYKNSESFLNIMNKTNKGNILLLSNFEGIIQDFIKNNLQECNDRNMSSKEIYFLWNLYILHNKYPFIYNEKKIISSIQEKITFNVYFLNIKSNLLEEVKTFIDFIEESCELSCFDYQYEIDELLNIFNKNIQKECFHINDEICLYAIQYFLPHFKIYENKFISLKCKYWDKNKEITSFIENNNKINSLYDLYEIYTKENYEYIANKEYFQELYNRL